MSRMRLWAMTRVDAVDGVKLHAAAVLLDPAAVVNLVVRHDVAGPASESGWNAAAARPDRRNPACRPRCPRDRGSPAPPPRRRRGRFRCRPPRCAAFGPCSRTPSPPSITNRFRCDPAILAVRERHAGAAARGRVEIRVQIVGERSFACGKTSARISSCAAAATPQFPAVPPASRSPGQ